MSATATLPQPVLPKFAAGCFLACPKCRGNLPVVEFSPFERYVGGTEVLCPDCEKFIWVPLGTASPRLVTIPFWLFATMNGNLLPFLVGLAKLPPIVAYDLHCGLPDCRAPIWNNLPLFAPRNGTDAIFECANSHPNWVQFIAPAPQVAIVPARMMEVEDLPNRGFRCDRTGLSPQNSR